MLPAQRRVYSFLVHGFMVHDGARSDLRQASVVALNPHEAILAAQMLIAPDADHHIDRWAVMSVQEINPKEAREWLAWHQSAAIMAWEDAPAPELAHAKNGAH